MNALIADLAACWTSFSQLLWTETAAAWAQAILTVLTVIGALWLSGRERRMRRRELRRTARTIADRCATVLHGLARKEEQNLFSSGNIDASRDEVDAALHLLDSLPIADLSPRHIPAYLDVRRWMTTARRRLRFIDDRLGQNGSVAGVGRFEELLESVNQASARLGKASA